MARVTTCRHCAGHPESLTANRNPNNLSSPFFTMLATTGFTTRAAAPQMMQLDSLKELAKAQNPVVGYFDPLSARQSNTLARTA